MASIQHRVRHGRDEWNVRWREGGREVKEQMRTFRSEADALTFKTELDRRQEARRVMGPDWGSPDWRPTVDPFGGFVTGPVQRDSFLAYAYRMIDTDASLRPGTAALYRRVLRLHFENTELGASPLTTITPEVIAEWWRRLPITEANGVRRQAHQVLAKVLNRAVAVGDLPSSPLKRIPEVKRPRTERPEIEALTVEQVEALADAAAKSQWDEYSSARNALEIHVMAYAGLRAGEVGALTRSDVTREGDRCKMRIRRQVTRIKGGDAALSPVKTTAGRRTIYIPCSLADEIDAFIAQYGTARDGRVFHGRKGALRYGHLINHSVASAGKRIGLDVNAHQLRHTAASLLRRSGADIRALQRFLGHADVRVTLQTYSHLYGEELGDLAERMERLRKG